MAKLVWRVKLIAVLGPGIVSETEVAGLSAMISRLRKPSA